MDSRTEKLISCPAVFRQMPETCILIDDRSRKNRLTFTGLNRMWQNSNLL